MASIKFLLQTKNETAPIYLRLSIQRGQVFKRKTGLSINPSDWNATKGLPKQTSAENKNLNTDLHELQTKILKQLNEANSKGEVITGDWLQYHIDLHFDRIAENRQSEFVLDVLENLIKTTDIRKNSKGGIGLSKSRKDSFKSLKSLFKEFQANKQYKIKEVNVRLTDAFLSYLLNDCNYSKVYATKKISDLKTVCYEAEGQGIKTNPQLRKIENIKIENEHVIYLNNTELEKIKNADIELPALINARIWLLLGCSIGQRGGDLLSLTEKNFVTRNGYDNIELKQQKTDKNITIPVLPITKEIIETGLPYKISIQRFNEYIKDVCRIAEIDQKIEGKIMDKKTKRKELNVYPKYKLITSHVCRRSFATNYYGELPTSLIMKVTGHSTEKMFLNYIGKDSLDFAQQIADYYTLQALKAKKEPQLEVVKDKKAV